METLEQQTSLFTEERLTSSPGDFLANRIHSLEACSNFIVLSAAGFVFKF
jgi:hypothetical protein